MNHIHYQDRLDFVRDLLQDRFAVEVLNIEPVEYDADCPFDYNNFIYKVQVSCHGSHQQKEQPGVTLLPLEVSHIIVRLSNKASGLPDHNRVENEVGMMLLFRQALANHHLGHLIPDVYGWGSAEGGQGWILQEFKHGSQLDRVFETASDQLKQSISTQMADIVYAMQTFEVPQTVTECGGVSFSPAGELVSGPMTTLSKGPFQTYAQSYKVFFEQQLTVSDKSPVLNGWQEDGLRARLMRFCADQLPDMTSAFDDSTKMIAHSDFTMNNMLIDEYTGKLTALLDFDWSFIGSFHDEVLRSFGDLGMIPGPDAEGDELILRQALLSSQNDQHNHEDSKDPLQDWYKILKTQGAKIPSDISGMEEASQLHWFVNQISPWLLTHEVPLKRRSKEQLEAARATTKQAICSFLDARGL